MALTGTHTQKDVPEAAVPTVVAGFKADGAKDVTVEPQPDGLFTVIAKFD